MYKFPHFPTCAVCSMRATLLDSIELHTQNVVYLYRRLNNGIPTAEVTSRPLTMMSTAGYDMVVAYQTHYHKLPKE